MSIWAVFAVMTVVASLIVLHPLVRTRYRTTASGEHEIAIYRDQLEEIERDLNRGVIIPAEAESARAEIARRLLAAAARMSGTAPSFASPMRRRGAALAILAGLPTAAFVLYGLLGSPHLPAQPIASRVIPAEQRDISLLVRQVEEALARNPEDGRGWDVIAPVYMQLHRYGDATTAFTNAIRLLGPSSNRQAGLGEALTGAARGTITNEARRAFEAVLTFDPSSPRARFWIARAHAQGGDTAVALDMLQGLLSETPADAPWRSLVEAEIDRLSGPAAGPSAIDITIVANVPPGERAAMIRGMVDRLAERLNQEPRDRDGWMRLIRAYSVLGEKDLAMAAVHRARRALGDTPQDVRDIEALARQLALMD